MVTLKLLDTHNF